jgi:hypothetical protein
MKKVNPYFNTTHKLGFTCSRRTWNDILLEPKQRKRDMRFGTWKVMSLYRAGSLITAGWK